MSYIPKNLNISLEDLKAEIKAASKESGRDHLPPDAINPTWDDVSGSWEYIDAQTGDEMAIIVDV